MQCWESDEFFSSRAVSSNQTSGPVVVSLGSCVPTDWLDWLLTIHGELRVSMAEGGRGGRRAEPPYKPGFVVSVSWVTPVTGTHHLTLPALRSVLPGAILLSLHSSLMHYFINYIYTTLLKDPEVECVSPTGKEFDISDISNFVLDSACCQDSMAILYHLKFISLSSHWSQDTIIAIPTIYLICMKGLWICLKLNETSFRLVYYLIDVKLNLTFCISS